MKTNKLEKIIRHIVNEAVNMMQEEHQDGEWWIDETGETSYADIDIGEFRHENYVINYLAQEILSHFDIPVDDPGELSAYEEDLKKRLIADGRLNDEELAGWENLKGSKYKGPVEILIIKLLEDKVYQTPEQAKDAVFIAYGSTKDARDYAMKYLGWKIMKTSGSDIEIQTWHLTPKDLGSIVRGIWDITEDTEDPNDPDNKVGPDGYPGPRINVTVEATGKRFHDIPLAVLEKKIPSSLLNYRSGLPWEFGKTDLTKKENLTEDYHYLHKEYRLYEGVKHIVALFEDNSRLKFEVHFHDNHGPDKEKWRHKAFTTWKSVANEIHGDVQLSEAGNPIQKSWKQSFQEALKHPKVEQYIRRKHHKRVFPDKGYPPNVQGKPQTVVDPVNFTPRR